MSRVALLKVFFLTFALLIVGRAVQLQMIGNPRLKRLARQQFNSQITAMPRRGLIFDQNGESLAINLKVHSLFFRPEFISREMTHRERTRAIYNLAHILHMPVSALTQKARAEKGFV